MGHRSGDGNKNDLRTWRWGFPLSRDQKHRRQNHCRHRHQINAAAAKTSFQVLIRGRDPGLKTFLFRAASFCLRIDRF